MTDGLKDAHREAIIAKIAANDRVERAVLFGSRATGTNTVSSDVDIALFGDRLTLTDQARLAAALDEIPMAQPVDLVLHNAIESPRLLDHIQAHGVELYTSRKPRVANGWAETSLGQVIELKRGYDLPGRDRVAGPVPVVSSSGVTGYHRESKAAGPGVVTGRYGTLGEVYFIQDDFWPLNTTLYVRDFKGNDPRFVNYLLRGLDFSGHSDKAAVPGLNRNHMHQEPVRIPTDVREQRAIAHILGTLDDKIELNRRMNATLEAMARALFRSWFVDFDPVRAKMEGRDTGLPKDIADLFSERLVDSELGEIPEGWKSVCVSDVCQLVQNGGTPKRTEARYWNGKIDWFKTAELDDGPLLTSEERISDAGLRESSCKLWPVGTVLIALYASPTVGRLGILGTPATANQACSALVANADFGSFFLFYSLLFSRRHFQSIAVGAVQQNISQDVVKRHKVIAPLSPLARAFESTVYDLHQRRITCLRECRALSTLRDALLPKLISGELRVNVDEATRGRDGRSASVAAHEA